MKLGVPSVCSMGVINVSEFILEDFRTISFLIETDNDQQLYDFLVSKIDTPCNAFDKFFVLLEARKKFVNEIIVLNNGKSDIKLNLNIWSDLLKGSVEPVKTELMCGDFTVIIDYPVNFSYNSFEDFLLDCIYNISFKNTSINFSELNKEDKYKVLEKIPLELIDDVKTYIEKNMNYSITLMKSTLGLPEILINLFDGSMFVLLKTLYNYYNYDDILETIYFLSKRISDVSYINTRTPRDLEFLIDLYSEEVEKTNQETKSVI